MKKMLYAVALSAMTAGAALAGEAPLTDTQMDALTAGRGGDDQQCCTGDRTNTADHARNINQVSGDNNLNVNNNQNNGGIYNN